MKLLPLALSSLLFLSALFADPVKQDVPQRPFKLGLISILSGQFSESGQGMVNVSNLAVEDYLQGHPGESIKLIVEDDGADQRKGLSAFLKLRDMDKADMILPVSTFAIGSVHALVNKEKKITFIIGNEPYEPEDDYIYMLSPAQVPAEEGLGKYVAQKHPAQKVIIFASQNEALYRFARAVKAGIGEQAEIVDLSPDTSDLRSVVLQAKKKSPTALVFNTMPQDAARILKEIRFLKWEPELYFDENISNSLADFKEVLGDVSMLRNATLLKVSENADSTLSKRYQDRFKTPLPAWSDFAYDVVMLALAVKNMTGDQAKSYLDNINYKGVTGEVSFDKVGLRKPFFKIINLRDHPNLKDEFNGSKLAKN